MRWSWRADLLPVALDGLFEGSLVGVAYLALAYGSAGSGIPLSLIEFCLAAGAGVVCARLRPRRAPRALWITAFALLAGALGWLADPAARAAMAAHGDLLGTLHLHAAGWLLGVAVIRGSVHEQAADEIEISTRSFAYAFPVLAASWLLRLGSGGSFVGPALVGSAICVGAGLLAIGHARLRELELLGSDTRGGRTWPMLATGVVVVVAAVAIPTALLTGTSARDVVSAMGGPVGGAIGALFAPVGSLLALLASALGQLLSRIHLPSLPGLGLSGNGSSGAGEGAGGANAPGGSAFGVSNGSPPLVLVILVVLLGLAIVGAVLTVIFRRLVAARPAVPVATRLREERHREIHGPKFTFHLALPAIHSPVARRRPPASAAEAYVALLDELADRGEFARRPAETPRSHTERAGTSGLPRLPLGYLAADYQLAIYGRTEISDRETARALGRWRRLRQVVRDLRRGGNQT
ncbi:MAG: DUF4129 domain-containing protein [Candidatus Limnocylindrales bacterium]|jgi:hypothetical protein